ncbi:MAG: DoxX family protein [Gemmatimonadetes bacterium]|nr:DoxX family protein [Gemmatimonadota bacterium]
MSFLNALLAPNLAIARALNLTQPLFALALRLYVGWQFFKAGWLKVTAWDTTLWLFENEYRTPLLPPAVAAVLGTIGELAFPLLLFVGLLSRLGALGLSAVNAMAVVSYAHFLLAEGSEAALGQHALWGVMLLTLAVYGPGKISLDYLLSRPRGAAGATRDATPVAI